MSRIRCCNTPRGAWEEIRTPDLRITNALLYRLSYPGATKKTTRLATFSLRGHALELHQREHEIVQQQGFVDVGREALTRLENVINRPQ